MILDTKSKLMGFFQDYFFGSDNVVDLRVCAADEYPEAMATICKHIMTAEFLPLDRMNCGLFVFVKTMRQTSLRHVRTCKQSEKEGTGKCQSLAAVRNEKDLRKAILKIAYYDGTSDSV